MDGLAMLLERLTTAGGQMEPIRDDQVVNSAGGYVWTVSDENRVRRFLILGTTGGSYYASEQKLTSENTADLKKIVDKGKAAMLLQELVEISLGGRAAKQEPTLYALALCARYKVQDCRLVLKQLGQGDSADKIKQITMVNYYKLMHKAAFEAVNQVCRIPTHLFSFVEYCEQVSKDSGGSTGWGRAMRDCVTNWYATKEPMQLAVHITKYVKRNGWSHRDLLRLAHPKTDELDRGIVYSYAVKGTLLQQGNKRAHDGDGDKADEPAAKATKSTTSSNAVEFLRSVVELKAATEAPVAAALIASSDGLVREHVPTDLLNSTQVWVALLAKMPMTAMMRNLAKMTSIGVLQENNEHVGAVVGKLTDQDELVKARVHPLNVLTTAVTYASGHGERGNLVWQPVSAITTALDTAFELAFKNATPTGKRYCLAVDVSGSMGCKLSGSVLTCRQAAAALAVITLRVEQCCSVVGFSHQLVELPYTSDWSVDKVVTHMDTVPMGATDCALPMIWAREGDKQFDVFIVITDSETWFGKVHPAQALKDYRTKMGVADAKLIVMGLVANKFTIADPLDPGMLDVVGFDSAVPTVISDFVLGKI